MLLIITQNTTNRCREAGTEWKHVAWIGEGYPGAIDLSLDFGDDFCVVPTPPITRSPI